eukprot:Em0016g220a
MQLIARYKDIGSEYRRLLDNAQGMSQKRHRTYAGAEAPCITVEGSSNEPRVPTDEAALPSEKVTNTSSDQELRLPVIIENIVPPAAVNSPFTELENLCFSSDSSEDEEQVMGAERLPEINTHSIPLPAVLQYLRESEAIASRYFSLSAKYKSKRKRHERNPTHPPTLERIIPAGGVEMTSTVPSRPSSGKREVVMVTCDFCGKKIQRLSLLESLNGSYTELLPLQKITSFCCDDYKQFSILVAASMRQMFQKGTHSKVKSIKISSDKKTATIQKTAEERALAMMIRKRKWEERKAQKLNFLQSTSFHSLTKHTKTIEFSLLSPKILDTGWMVNPDPQNEAVCKKAQRKGHTPKPISSDTELPQTTKLTPLPNIPPTSPLLAAKGPLKTHKYPDGTSFTTILPDRTGQCYYTSGRIAILIYMLSQGALGYLVFEDDDGHTLLGTLEEGGRSTCYDPNGTIRLVLTPHHGVILDEHQSIKRKWTWMGGAGNTLFQPISLQLNKSVVLRCCQQDSLVLSFSAANNHTKFFIGREQKTLPGLNVEDREDLKNGDSLSLEDHLQETKAKISALLGKLQYPQRLQRIHGFKAEK